MQELEESIYWLELLAEAHIFTPEKLMPLMTEADELMAILTTCVKKAKANLISKEPQPAPSYWHGCRYPVTWM
jgi:hypothetical protein